MYFDAHNHWQDSRLDGLDRPGTLAALREAGVRRMVVNGTSPEDWQAVAQAARADPDLVLPSFGVHPWNAAAVGAGWEQALREALASVRGPVGVGEIGLDRWVAPTDFEQQLAVFRTQWRLGAEKNLPITVHCLRAWGPLMDELRRQPVPDRGFLIHSPGASPETIRALADLGGYFSVSGAFAAENAVKYRRALHAIPIDRLLIETDAPDMSLPEGLRLRALADPETGQPVTHPLDLVEVYGFVSTELDLPISSLQDQVAGNFQRFFGEAT